MTAPADLETTLQVLRERREEVRSRFQVELYGVVGSLARGEAKADSDVDIFAEWMKGTTLFRVSGAAILLEDALGRNVDLIDSKMLRPAMRSRMEADLIRL